LRVLHGYYLFLSLVRPWLAGLCNYRKVGGREACHGDVERMSKESNSEQRSGARGSEESWFDGAGLARRSIPYAFLRGNSSGLSLS
jgi:hypothetical protein